MLTHFDFHLNAFFITLCPKCDISINGVFNTFFPLSRTFYFETRPSPLSKIGENAFGEHFLPLYRKNENGNRIFYFMILIRTVLPFDERKIGTNLCSVFWQFY